MTKSEVTLRHRPFLSIGCTTRFGDRYPLEFVEPMQEMSRSGNTSKPRFMPLEGAIVTPAGPCDVRGTESK